MYMKETFPWREMCRYGCMYLHVFSYHNFNFVVITKDKVSFQGNIHINHPVFTQRDRCLSRVRSDTNKEAHLDRRYLQSVTLVFRKVNMQCIKTHQNVCHSYGQKGPHSINVKIHVLYSWKYVDNDHTLNTYLAL